MSVHSSYVMYAQTGKHLSPFLFNVYMDYLSKQLNGCRTGCMVGHTVINHLMFADDLVIFYPYSAVCYSY